MFNFDVNCIEFWFQPMTNFITTFRFATMAAEICNRSGQISLNISSQFNKTKKKKQKTKINCRVKKGMGAIFPLNWCQLFTHTNTQIHREKEPQLLKIGIPPFLSHQSNFRWNVRCWLLIPIHRIIISFFLSSLFFRIFYFRNHANDYKAGTEQGQISFSFEWRQKKWLCKWLHITNDGAWFFSSFRTFWNWWRLRRRRQNDFKICKKKKLSHDSLFMKTSLWIYEEKKKLINK